MCNIFQVRSQQLLSAITRNCTPVTTVTRFSSSGPNWLNIRESILERNLTVVTYVGNHLRRKELYLFMFYYIRERNLIVVRSVAGNLTGRRMWRHTRIVHTGKYSVWSNRLADKERHSVSFVFWERAWEKVQNDICAQHKLRSAWASAQSVQFSQSWQSAWVTVGSMAIQEAPSEYPWSDFAEVPSLP